MALWAPAAVVGQPLMLQLMASFMGGDDQGWVEGGEVGDQPIRKGRHSVVAAKERIMHRSGMRRDVGEMLKYALCVGEGHLERG